ncbi:MAG: hypothetical protein M1821_007980 [Bathelium mastoideum]|nr:MAG: hypothetical protein M1821_007980 [Bathelium mastoideum]
MVSTTDRPTKRPRLDFDDGPDTNSKTREATSTSASLVSESDAQDGSKIGYIENKDGSSTPSVQLRTLARVVTPPKHSKPSTEKFPTDRDKEHFPIPVNKDVSQKLKIIPSPIQLMRIRDLPSYRNIDTISLSDIIGDPLIKECWQFNYLFDVDFIIKHLDEDVRNLVKVKIVHGSWKKEDRNRLGLEEAAKRYENVQLIAAYMPEPFGTHHSKMMILIRHDDSAQIVIHTANMIAQDWTNLCQAMWRSPLLPLSSKAIKMSNGHPIGHGERFKADLLRYLGMYGKRLGDLAHRLEKYDFGSIRAAFIASTPCRQATKIHNPSTISWGWLGLRQILHQIPSSTPQDEEPIVNVQVSSVATLGHTDSWLQNLFDVLSDSKPQEKTDSTLSDSASGKKSRGRKPEFHVIFPTADTIRRSLNGYVSGRSIHWKLQSAAQQAQLKYLRPYLCHWSYGPSNSVTSQGDSLLPTPSNITRIREAGRRRAAPHIKTYIRFSDQSQSKIDWVMLTSANLSTQAWGTLPGKDSEVRISSWETGVVVWPTLLVEDKMSTNGDKGSAVMVPTFGIDTPSDEQAQSAETEKASMIVGLRMPYDLPLVPYSSDDEPWCATAQDKEADWQKISWM